VPVLLLTGGDGSPDSTAGLGAAAEPTWERTDFAPDVTVKDLATTGFGLVAAAGYDGVWISRDGGSWSQALVGPYEPPVEPATTPAPPLTASPDPPVVSSQFGAVLEFNGRLYAFGRIYVSGQPSDPQLPQESGVLVWSSDDGLTWERTTVGPFPQVIDAVATNDAIFLFGRDVRHGEDDGPPDLATSIVRSTDGTRWEPVTARGLDGTVLWAVAPSEDGLVALGECNDRYELARAVEEGRIPNPEFDQAFVFTSTDGVTWLEVGPWTISPLNQSAWPQVDLFTSPHGIVAVSATEDLPPLTGVEPSQIVIAISTDGATFSVVDTSDPALLIDDVRGERWPPMTPPEGTVFGDRIIMLGLSYPNPSGEPSYQQWTAPINAITPPAAGGL
jgi:hypothetical protein